MKENKMKFILDLEVTTTTECLLCVEADNKEDLEGFLERFGISSDYVNYRATDNYSDLPVFNVDEAPDYFLFDSVLSSYSKELNTNVENIDLFEILYSDLTNE